MKTIGIIALVGVIALGLYSLNTSANSNVETQFQEFLAKYGQNYGTTEEYSFRLGVFSQNMETVERLTLENPEATFGVTKFSDKTEEEMMVMMGFNAPAGKNLAGKQTEEITAHSSDFSYLYDHVEDQGNCGSCWAFSAAATFEAREALSSHTDSDEVETFYSEQQLVDCEPQSSGCNGGLMTYAFEFLTSHHFCDLEAYPYVAKDQRCQIPSCETGPVDTDFVEIEGQENFMYEKLHDEGPIAVAVDATTWPHYKGGILKACNRNLNHGVTLVGYNSDDNTALVRNSWSETWGEAGYIRLAAGENTCGIASMASYPTFA